MTEAERARIRRWRPYARHWLRETGRRLISETKDRPCIACGRKLDRHRMVLHHRDPGTKSFGIAEWVSRRYGLGRLRAEIEKCDPMCGSCHSKLHWQLRRAKEAA